MHVWQGDLASAPSDADLVLVYGPREAMADLPDLSGRFPGAVITGCSGAGQIHGTSVTDGITVTTVRFDHTQVRLASAPVDQEEGTAAGLALADQLPKDGLRHVMVFSDGLHVNGTALAAAMQAGLPAGVSVTGGLAGDGDRFEDTIVLAGARASNRQIAAIGFYGEKLHVGFGSLGGWDPFGPTRKVTRSSGNVVFELDGQPALGLYKRYLGEQAEDLPASGLLFPLFLQDDRGGLVRTILAVDEAEQSLTFAGDVPQGAMGQFMKANFDRLVDGAQAAAKSSNTGLQGDAELGILVSCVGRRLVLKQRVEDELDAVREVLGAQAAMTGFYSYGEICPLAPGADCQLHNQTMTITTLREG